MEDIYDNDFEEEFDEAVDVVDEDGVTESDPMDTYAEWCEERKFMCPYKYACKKIFYTCILDKERDNNGYNT